MAMKFTGSICLSDIPKLEIKAFPERDANGNYVYETDKNGQLIPLKDESGQIMYEKDANGHFLIQNGQPVVAYKKKVKYYTNISIHENKEPYYTEKVVDGKVQKVLLSDHFISCAPKKEERVEGVNYIIGNLKTWVERQTPNVPLAADINSAPSVSAEQAANLPF